MSCWLKLCLIYLAWFCALTVNVSPAFGLTTTYDYSGTGGLLKSILYSDNTPDTTTTYNRLGQTETITDASGLRTFLTDPDGFVQSETITGGLLGGTTLSTTPDALRRPGAFTLTNDPFFTTATTYTWHPQEGRLQKITSGSTEVTYTRHTDSALLHRTESRQANNLRLSSERTFDFLERLTDLTHTGPPAPAAFGSEVGILKIGNLIISANLLDAIFQPVSGKETPLRPEGTQSWGTAVVYGAVGCSWDVIRDGLRY